MSGSPSNCDAISVNRAFYASQYARAWKIRLQYDPVSKHKLALRGLRRLGAAREVTRVLDIGFGAGLTLFAFGPSCALYGVELAPTAVEDATRRARRRGVGEYGFVTYDGGGAIPFPDGRFDVVICSHVLEHVPDDRFLLSEIRRLLRPGGGALLNVPINDSHYADPHHVRRYTPAGFLGLLKTAGLDVCRAEPADRIWNLFGWFFERRMHRRLGRIGFLLSAVVNLYFAAIPAPLLEVLDGLLDGVFPPRQFVVAARRSGRSPGAEHSPGGGGGAVREEG